LALAAAISSLTDLVADSGGATRINGVVATCEMPTKSFWGSNDRFLLRLPMTVWPLDVSISV
jgi:hypothetical protein